jgi:hypothetical protein
MLPDNNTMTNVQSSVTGFPNTTARSNTTALATTTTKILTTTSRATNGITNVPTQPQTPPPTSLAPIFSMPPLILVDTEVQLVFKQLLPNIPIAQVPIISANKSVKYKHFF